MNIKNIFQFDYLWKRKQRLLTKVNTVLFQQKRLNSIPVGEEDKKILQMLNKHEGKRAFIIGNGPSLRVADLDRLQKEITFASNKIYLAYESTCWRPTYYCVFDNLVAFNNRDKINECKECCLFSSDLKHLLKKRDNTVWIREIRNHELTNDKMRSQISKSEEIFSKNVLYGIGSAGTVVYHQLQIAFYMGITEVIILGVDFSFDIPTTKVNTNMPGYETALKSQGELNHFHPDYRKQGEVWAVPDMGWQLRGFSLADDVYKQNGRKIYNASRKTMLNVFERVNADDILP